MTRELGVCSGILPSSVFLNSELTYDPSVEGYELLQEGIVASLSVHRVAWKAAFPNMTIKMGQVESKLDYQPREELLRRQDTPTPTSSTSAATTTATDLSLATQIVNKDLDFEFVDAGCTNCTTTGSLGFDATFDLDDYSGEATIVLNGFSAYMALHVNVPDSNKYEIPLPFERNVTVNVSPLKVTQHPCLTISLTTSIAWVDRVCKFCLGSFYYCRLFLEW